MNFSGKNNSSSRCQSEPDASPLGALEWHYRLPQVWWSSRNVRLFHNLGLDSKVAIFFNEPRGSPFRASG
jgi:hypothetical protein